MFLEENFCRFFKTSVGENEQYKQNEPGEVRQASTCCKKRRYQEYGVV